MQMKKCSVEGCGYHPVSEFYVNRKIYYSAKCKPCSSLYYKQRYSPTYWTRPEAKVHCPCGETDPDMFYNNSWSSTGKQWRCKKCQTEEAANYRSKTKSKSAKIEEIRAMFRYWCETGEW